MEKYSFLKDPKYFAPTDYKIDASYDFSVLMSKEELDELAKEISEIIRHPVTIIDAKRIGKVADLSSIRANSDSEFLSLRPSCRLFRHYAGDDGCFERDHAYALKFMEYLELHDKEQRKIVETQYCDERNGIDILRVYGFNRFVAEYRCPMSGYRELMIPIFYNRDLIIGIMFVGQILLKKTKVDDIDEPEFVKQTKTKYFDENEPKAVFKKYPNITTDLADRVKNWIVNADDNFGDYESLFRVPNGISDDETKTVTMNFWDQNEYFGFIESTCDYMRKVEKILIKTFAEKRQKYFKEKSKKIVTAYLEKIFSVHNVYESVEGKTNRYNLKTTWDALFDATDKLKDEFNIDEIYLLGDGTTIKDDTKKPLYLKNKSNDKVYYDYEKLYKTSVLQDNEYLSSFNNGINLGLHGLDKSNLFIILFTNFVIAFRVENLDQNQETYKTMANEIGEQFKKIVTSIALATSEYMQEKQLKTLRMNKHENAHISSRINDRLEFDFADKGEAFLKLKPEKREFVIEDLQNSAKLLSNMADNIGIITGSITEENVMPNVGLVNVQEVLTKWQKMFRDKLADRNLNLEIVRSYRDYRSTTIETVPNLFELLIYNIVDNAVKYAYRGTNIYLSWDIEDGNNVFKATNYGPEIEDDKIFDLYFRGKTNKSQRVEGDGIGLYSVKRICELLDCEVTYTNELVSEYNLPLIEWYFKKFGIYGVNKSYELNYYFDNMVDLKTKTEIINVKTNEIQPFDVTKQYLNERIDDKMYKTVFIVEIPDSISNEK